MKWKIHLDREEKSQYKTESRYSITIDENHAGWRTDSGYEGYGFPKELAEWICDILNKHGTDCCFGMKFGRWYKNEVD